MKEFRPGTIVLMAVTCGLAVANIYYSQPLLAEMGRSLGVGSRAMGVVAMLTQAGYAAGMLAFIPLGDLLDRKRLSVGLMLGVCVALIGLATAPNVWIVGAFSFLVGMFAVAAQVLIPLAASVAPLEKRGSVIGSLYTGLLLGILLARTVSGFVGSHAAMGALPGWRVMYFLAAGIALGMSVTLMLLLPRAPHECPPTYQALMRSLGHLVKAHPELREASVVGAMIFGAFSCFWVTLTYHLEGAPFHKGPEWAGMFGLIGAAGAFVAPVAGRLADKRGPRFVVGCAIVTTLVAYLVLWGTGNYLWGLIAGVIILDAGVQANQVCNQARIFALAPSAQGRVNTVYMISYFTGGAVGSYCGSQGWAIAGWDGVCIAGLALVGVASVARLCAYVSRPNHEAVQTVA